MRTILLRVPRVLAFVLASCVGGWYLGALISRSSLWIPAWLWDTMRAVVRISGIHALYNEDDVEMLCLFFLTIASCIVVALALRFAWFIAARYVRKRRSVGL
jgi:hypothetical protein